MQPGAELIAGRFRVLGSLGQGGQGRVLRVQDEGRPGSPPRALKTLVGEGTDPALAAVLRAELQRVREAAHPGLVEALDLVVDEAGRPWLLMALAEGPSLLEAAQAAGPPGDPARTRAVLELCAPVLLTLEHLHARGLVHLDLKPEHLVLTAQGPVLLDLGLAARAGEPARRGTPGYAAPEVLLGHPVDRRADLFSLGATLLHALSGAPPPRAGALDPGAAPTEARELLAALLAPERTRRPASAGAALGLLERALGRPLAAPGRVELPPLEGPLEGRDTELDRLLAPLEGEAPPVLLLSGPRGAGRTRLLREAAARAVARGARVHQPGLAEGEGPLGPVLPLLGWLGVPLTGGEPDPERARARLLVEAGRRAAAAADEGPLVIVADDLDQLPEAALEVLGAVAAGLRARARPGAALWLACAEEHGGGAGLLRLVRDLALEPLRLTPLPAAVLRQAAPRLPDPGSPERAALEALALLGGAAPAGVLGAVSDPAALTRLAGGPLLQRQAGGLLRLTWPAARPLLLAELAPERARDLARRLGEALRARQAGSPAQRAELALLAGGAGADPGPVLSAARQALESGALAAAAGWLLRLLALDPDPAAAAEARDLLARAELARGEGQRAVQAWQAVAAAPEAPPAARAAASARAARQLLVMSCDPEALAEATRAGELIERAGPGAPQEQLAAARCDVVYVRELAAAYADPAGHQPDRVALEELRAAGASGAALASLGTTLGIVLYRASRLEPARALLEQAARDARSAGDRRGEGWALLNLAVCLSRQGQAAGAARVGGEARLALEAAGDVRGVATADLEAGLRLLRASRYRASAELLGAALRTFALLGDAPRVAELRLNRGAARLRLGDLPGAAADLAAAASGLAEPGLRLFCAGDRALLAAEQGDAAGAEAQLALAGELAGQADAHFALQGRVQRAAVLLRLGRGAEALLEARTARHAARQAGADDLAAAAASALAEAELAAGDPRAALQAAQEAARAGEEPADRARPEAVAARAHLLLGELPAARVAAGRALEAAQAGEDAQDRLLARQAQGQVLLACGDAAGAARALGPAALAARAAGLARRAGEAEALLARALEPPALLALERLEGGEGPRPEGGGLLAKVVAGGPDAGHMLDLALGLLVEATGAERGLLVLLDEAGRPTGTAARNLRDEELSGPRFAYSRRLVEEAAQRRAPVLVADALADPRFSEAESVASLAIRSVLTVPVPGVGPGDPPVLAVLYLDDRTQPGRFGEEAAELARRLTAELAPAFRLVREQAALQRDAAGLRSRVEEAALQGATRELVGESEPARALRRAIARAARTDLPVLVEGESGSGKELIARAIHAASRRASGPFVAESCAAVADTLLESELFGHVRGAFTGAEQSRRGIFAAASGGTLFLDEVSSMSAPMQAKLLRVLQEGQVRPVGAETTERVDVRVIAASNERLAECVAQGRFRQDLYYRLAVIGVPAPPLRERREDVPLLVDHFARKHGGESPPLVSEAALRALAAHAWPGNVRELENVVRRLVAFRVRRVLVRHLPEEVRACVKDARPGQAPRVEASRPLEEELERIEREQIGRALRQARGNVSQAARSLGMERTKLIRRLKHLGIEP